MIGFLVPLVLTTMPGTVTRISIDYIVNVLIKPTLGLTACVTFLPSSVAISLVVGALAVAIAGNAVTTCLTNSADWA